MKIYEDISNCDQSRNEPVPVVNNYSDKRPPVFTYTDKLIFRFDVTISSKIVKCKCNQFYNENGLLKVKFNTTLFECVNPECKFGFIQMGLKTKLEIFYQKTTQFWGVKARQFIPKGSFICEYIGEIHEGEPEIAKDDYIFSVVDDGNENGVFPKTDEGEPQCWTINSDEFGNVARFINHSCFPNIASYNVRVGNEPFLRIAFFAGHDIFYGEELTIDYGDFWWSKKIDKIQCKCFTSNCRWKNISVIK